MVTDPLFYVASLTNINWPLADVVKHINARNGRQIIILERIEINEFRQARVRPLCAAPINARNTFRLSTYNCRIFDLRFMCSLTLFIASRLYGAIRRTLLLRANRDSTGGAPWKDYAFESASDWRR